MLPFICKQAIRANKKSNIVYLNNPKVGCSTVKFNLWKCVSPETHGPDVDVHDLKASPFSSQIAGQGWLKRANIFTFVRNPYKRIVSAYLNKIRQREMPVWQDFCNRYGFDVADRISFESFVDAIFQDDPEYLDPHWRPQYINVMYPFIEPNFIGRLEDMDRDLPRVLSRFLGKDVEQAPRRNVHGTNADEKFMQFFECSATLRKVRKLYEKDFEHFGYSRELDGRHDKADPPEFREVEHHRLDLLQSLFRMPGKSHEDEVVREAIRSARETGDPFARNWALHLSLNARSGEPAAALAEIRSQLGEIQAGFGFLKRTAARIAAANGAWPLVHQIASAELKRRYESRSWAGL